MCIIIDANTFCSVFNTTSTKHYHFEPVYRWIIYGKGFLVYGGTTYKNELKNAATYLGLFVELKKSGKAVEVDEDLVDQEERTVYSIIKASSTFDDGHLVAIVRISGCRLICTEDKSSDKYIKKKSLYRKGQKPPAIYRYRSRRHVRLLCNKNIVAIRNAV